MQNRAKADAVFSEKDTLGSVDNDPELLREVVGMFMTESENSHAVVRKTIDDKNALEQCAGEGSA